MAYKYEAIIIGAGIIGAATALALVRKGVKVLGLDKFPAAGYGSTSGSCAIIRPYYSTVDGCAIAGEMMAELITKCEAGRDHDTDPVTFHLRYTGRTISLGFYSRRREINRDSSFSVLG